ncbi:MAG: hypothetical protein MEFUS_02638 [Fusobacterium varium]|jgi:hypothetical protein
MLIKDKNIDENLSAEKLKYFWEQLELLGKEIPN